MNRSFGSKLLLILLLFILPRLVVPSNRARCTQFTGCSHTIWVIYKLLAFKIEEVISMECTLIGARWHNATDASYFGARKDRVQSTKFRALC